MLQKKNNIIHNRNLGIELLRMILCFWILSFHCLNKEKISNCNINKNNPNKIKLRLFSTLYF